MIILLPLRSWVGDVMATEMVSSGAMHQQTATHAGAEPTLQAELTRAAPDCAGHGAPEGTPEANAHCATCTVCQACHTVALVPEATQSAAVLPPPAMPYSPAAVFASALVALGQKPPIS